MRVPKHVQLRTTRRRFLLVGGSVLGGLALVRCTGPLVPDLSDLRPIACPRVPLASLTDLTVGVPFDFDYPEAGVECFAVKLGASAQSGVGPDGDIVAFSYLCTHMGCSLRDTYDHEHAVLGPCSCHFSTFSLAHDGMVVLGQATQSLVRIELEVEADQLIATGLVGVIYGEIEDRCCPEPEAGG